MENIQSQKLGAGIIIISIIQLIASILGILGTILILTQKDAFIEQGVPLPLSNTQIITNLIFITLMIISIILILFKKSIGVYGYYTVSLLSIINAIMDTGFQWSIILSLIFPILLAFFINKKKKLFNF